MHRAFHQAYDCLSCAVREPDLSQRTNHRFYRLWRSLGSVDTFNVTLQLEGSRKLVVAVLAGGAVFPAVTSLPFKSQMVLHVIQKLDAF